MAAAQHVERGQLTGLLDPQPALQQQLEHGPVPERLRLSDPPRPGVRRDRERLLGVVPAADRERAQLRDLPLEIDHLLGGLRLRAAPDLLEPYVPEVVTLERHRRRCVLLKRRAFLGTPGAHVREEAADVRQPLHRGRAVLPLTRAGAALRPAGELDRLGNERARVRGTDLGASADLGEPLVDEAPEMLKRVVFVTRRGIDVGDPLLIRLEIHDVSGPEALRDPRALRQLGRGEPAAAHPSCRAPQRRSPEHPERAQRSVQHVAAGPDGDRHGPQVLIADLIERAVSADHHDPKCCLQRLVPQRHRRPSHVLERRRQPAGCCL